MSIYFPFKHEVYCLYGKNNVLYHTCEGQKWTTLTIQHSNIGDGKIYDKDDDALDNDKVIHTPAANPKLPSRIFLWNYQKEDDEKDTFI